MGAPTLTADPRSGIEAGNRRFMEALAKGDAGGIAKLYTAKGQLLPPNSDFVIGTAAIQNYWRGAIEKGVRGAVLETLEVEAHGDLACEVGRYTLKAADGQVADTGKYLLIWKQEGGAWKVHRDVWTTSLPTA
jgi:uncharacterized protein (TIGR02246 family)